MLSSSNSMLRCEGFSRVEEDRAMSTPMPGDPFQTLGDLEEVVSLRLPETAQLEFKKCLPEPHKNQDLAKDISAMANTDGGTLIYGIAEKAGLAEALTPFALANSPERIALVARSSIDEPIKIEAIHRIEDPQRPGDGFLVVNIARSRRAPHFVEGTAWGRTPNGNTQLTRRRIGELFAASTGFAAEFHLVSTKPGRVRVTTKTEPYHDPGSSAKFLYWLVLENDGESDVDQVNWKFDTTHISPAPIVESNPFPVQSLKPGGSMQMRIYFSGSVRPPRIDVIVEWNDQRGKPCDERWPVSW